MQKSTAPLVIIKLLLMSMLFLSSISYADQALTQRKEVQRFINNMVTQHGFKKQTLVAVFNDATLQPQIIESMNMPFEKKDWDTYRELFLTPQRLQEGLAFWQANQKALKEAEKRYQVPANIIVSILGVETLYGKHQGNYRVIDALSTLAFNYPKRSNFFSKELSEYLLLCREHHINPNQYLGSYAGAIGKPQFMPSSYRYYAADFKNNSKIDLINDDEAVIASVANYFHKHGWAMNQGVAQPAKISGLGIKHINTQYKKAVYDPSLLARSGVHPLTAAMNQPKKAGVIELTTPKGTEYWLAYPNFYVITRYNSNPQYALVVYLFAQHLQRQWVAASNKPSFAYS
ncbi:MAG: lytic murein transglycosylase B [Legionellales bacterium RIFCSPHIGHO2_12_FULL_42_9]|nr:MAG: lytic murein transglycosylase B [Legionellales bacterium RIFCSPHIGHO2_12_FULL_42_9]